MLGCRHVSQPEWGIPEQIPRSVGMDGNLHLPKLLPWSYDVNYSVRHVGVDGWSGNHYSLPFLNSA